MTTEPIAGAVIEILERRADALPEVGSGSVLVPNEVRINGQPLLCSAEDPVVVERVSIVDRDVVRVTLTLLARRVIIDDRPAGT